MDLGEVHSLVNCPIRPMSARLTADLQVSSNGSSTLGMHSSFLMNFCCAADNGLLEASTTSFLKASISGKRGEVGTDPPPASMAGGPVLAVTLHSPSHSSCVSFHYHWQFHPQRIFLGSGQI
jgi:endonuclease IV